MDNLAGATETAVIVPIPAAGVGHELTAALAGPRPTRAALGAHRTGLFSAVR
ncbi:hypothetical protein [Amycolatopsis plumensis]|uniref:hypothetical protein n=1 Tax=Amycolatopsis plumensis TaxID=236508 RepID=UPI0036227FC7